MTQAEYDLLLRLETSPAVFRPTESGPEGREAFQATVLLLLKLRAQGWVRILDGRKDVLRTVLRVLRSYGSPAGPRRPGRP